MDVAVKKTKDFERVLEISLLPEVVSKKIDTLYISYQKTLKIDGFRKGKVPMNVIKSKFDPAIKEKAVNESIQEAYKEVLQNENLNPITQGIIKDVKYSANDGLSFKAYFEIMPDIQPQDYKGMKIEKMTTKPTDEEKDAALKKLQDSRATFVPVLTRAALPGDLLVVDYDIWGEEKGIVRKNKISNATIILGNPELPQEITNGLVNSHPGDRRKVSLRFPLDWRDEKLRGKWIEYEFVIHEVKEKKLPPRDEKFAQELGFKSFKELRQQIENQLQTEKEKVARAQMATQIINQLIKDNPFESPKIFVNAYMEPMLKRTGDQIDDKTRKNIKEIAIWRAQREILLSQIAKIEKVELTEEEVKSKLTESDEVRKKGYKQTVEKLKKDDIYDSLVEEFKREKVLDLLISWAK